MGDDLYMARKHFDEYFQKISKQYNDLNSALQELSEEVNTGMYEPERLEQLKATIAPVKSSFETLNYIRYLLDKPTRKSKHTRYNRQNKKLIEQTKCVSMEEVVKNNQSVIDLIKR